MNKACSRLKNTKLLGKALCPLERSVLCSLSASLLCVPRGKLYSNTHIHYCLISEYNISIIDIIASQLF